MLQDIFQAKIDQTFEGCEGTIGIADDIVIFGKSEQEHNHHLHGMLARCRNTGLKLNPDKCKIKQMKIKFYGVICGEDGVQPDPIKVSALKQMAPPTNKQELQTFLGLATCMGPFISGLSTLTAPLRELVKEDSIFVWSPAHNKPLIQSRMPSMRKRHWHTMIQPKKSPSKLMLYQQVLELPYCRIRSQSPLPPSKTA